MGRGKGWIIIAILISLSLWTGAQNASACPGRIFNPITDVDWMGVFPIKIGGVTVASFGQEDTDTVGVNPICLCADPLPRIGIPVSFWEPVRILEVVRDRYTTRAEARQSIFEYIEMFYNRVRRHSTLGYRSPVCFEQEAMAA